MFLLPPESLPAWPVSAACFGGTGRTAPSCLPSTPPSSQAFFSFKPDPHCLPPSCPFPFQNGSPALFGFRNTSLPTPCHPLQVFLFGSSSFRIHRGNLLEAGAAHPPGPGHRVEEQRAALRGAVASLLSSACFSTLAQHPRMWRAWMGKEAAVCGVVSWGCPGGSTRGGKQMLFQQGWF